MNQDAFQKAMNDGHSAAWDQDWPRAAECYRAALVEFPDHPTALNSLGLAMFEQQNYDEALRFYQRAAQISPSDPLPVEKIGQIYERLNRLPDAIAALLQAAEVYLKARDVDKAIFNWRRVCALQPTHLAAHTRLAMILDRLGRKNEAVNEYLATASIMQSSGDIAKAMQVAEYCLQIQSNSVEAQQALTYLRTNQALPKPVRPRGFSGPQLSAPEVPQIAPAAELPRAPQLDPVAEARQKAMVQLAAQLFEQADDTAAGGKVNRSGLGALTRGTDKLTSDSADRTRILMFLGQAIDSQSQGHDPQAAQELERALDTGLRHPAAYFDLGLLHSKTDETKAVKYLKQAVRHPDFAIASYILLGEIHLRKDHLKDAAVAYLQALALADSETVLPEQADDLRQLYEPLIEAQNHDKEEKSLQEVCQAVIRQLVRPDWHEFLRLARQQLPPQPLGMPPLPLAEVLLESGSSQVVEALGAIRQLANQRKLTSAMEELYYTLQFAPTYLPLHVQIAELLLEEGRVQDAIIKFMLVCDLYSLRGEVNQAVRLLRRVTQIAPMDLSVRTRLIELQTAQGNVDDAIQESINLADIYYHLAELDQARQAYVTALKLADRAKNARSWSVQLLYKIADIDLQHLDLRKAIRAFEQVRTIAPEDLGARGQLIDLNYRLGQDAQALGEADSVVALLESGGKRQDALDFLQAMVNEHPQRLELRKRLADLWVRTGNITKAVEQLDTIADVMMASGNRAAAMTMLQAIINLNPPNVADYQAALAQLRGG